MNRQRLLKNEDIDMQMQTIQNTLGRIKTGAENPTEFDGLLFQDLVEKIIAVSQEEIRFRLYGGIELTEYIQGARR